MKLQALHVRCANTQHRSNITKHLLSTRAEQAEMELRRSIFRRRLLSCLPQKESRLPNMAIVPYHQNAEALTYWKDYPFRFKRRQKMRRNSSRKRKSAIRTQRTIILR